MSAVWATIAALTMATALIRAAGPLLLGGRTLPAEMSRVVGLLAPALLAALVVTETVSDQDTLVLDERIVGVAAAGLVLWRSDSVLLAIAAATVVAALARALA